KDPDLLAAWEIHERNFPDGEVADTLEDFKAYVDGSAGNLSALHKLDDIMVIAKFGTEVVGYLYAQYYIDRRTAFVSYLAIDKEFRVARVRRAATMCLLTELMRLCARQGMEWEIIVGEVERARPNKPHHGDNLFETFRFYENEASLREGSVAPGIFRMDLDY